MLGQVAGAIAHEVRNPLAIIRSLVQTLGDGATTDERIRRTCREVVDDIDRLASVTQSLTGLARPVRPRCAPVAASEVMRRTELLARHLLGSSAARLVVRCGDEASEVEVDADLICQVLLGLISNARAASDGVIELTAVESVEHLVFAVSDHGAGVPPDLRDRIFEPLFTTRAEGTGLGLAVARAVA